jgi:hypothetical protein
VSQTLKHLSALDVWLRNLEPVNDLANSGERMILVVTIGVFAQLSVICPESGLSASARFSPTNDFCH